MTKKQTTLLDKTAISRTVARLSHEIVERNHDSDNLALIGIQTRGEPLSKRIHTQVSEYSGAEIVLGSLDITFHRDDFRYRLVVPQVKGTNIPFTLDCKIVILVDDVLFTGRTIRAAIDALNAFGRPKAIQLAVLIDRGHREMPIRADFVGKNIPTHEGEHVAVRLKEVDNKDAVLLLKYDQDK